MNLLFSSILYAVVVSTVPAADWEQWRGPTHDGKSAETGLLKEWPAEGPKLLMKIDELGAGFSTPAIADRKIYITGMMEDRQLHIFCYDLSGSKVWEAQNGEEW